ALTIAVAVAVSLLVAITVLPTGAAYLMTKNRVRPAKATTKLVDRVSDLVMNVTSTPRRRWAWIGGLTLVPVALGFALFPSLNYLPPVKRAAIDGFVGLPSGASPDYVRKEIAEVIIQRLDPYMKGEKEPALLNYYVYAGPWGANIGVRAKDVAKLDDLNKIVNEEVLKGFPDTRVFAQQGDLFGNFGGGGGISIELQAADFDALADSVPAAIDIIQKAIPGAQVWPNPDPQVVTPEIRILPNDRRIAEVGMTRDAVARSVRAFGDGMWLGEFFHQDGRLDVILQATTKTTPETIGTIPIATPTGAIVPLSELATIGRSVGPQQIRRLDGRRTIALGINTPDEMPLGDVIKALKDGAEVDLYAALPAGASIKYAGEADSLKRAIGNLSANFGLAVCILFLILSALFKSVRDAALVIVALPMAAVGGVAAIRILNLVTPTPLDLLGMIGFIILLGLVVNNAILLVAQARDSEAEGLDRRAAVMEALRLRIRPIFLTTFTSIMGMLPLVVAPGAGAGIYRGLATVIVGGMAVSTLFTLILLPSLLQIGAARKREAGMGSPVLQPAE
ncbi:MAG: efflux RND transporter permease subunit, partial [Amphiplicatus sp.]